MLGKECKLQDVLKGWKEYSKRLEGMEIVPQLIDSLSFPLTIAYAIYLAGYGDKEEINIVLMGATEKAEYRIFAGSNYYEEILVLLPSIHKLNIYFVGPEIPVAVHLQSIKKTDKLKAWFYQGKIMEFFKEMGIGLNQTNTLFIGLNTGLGIKHAALIMSWVKDLKFLLKKKYSIVFTSANDYEDLAGETFIMNNILEANYIIQPEKNPFCGMTRYYLPGKDKTVSI